jgi:hypothetical protein
MFYPLEQTALLQTINYLIQIVYKEDSNEGEMNKDNDTQIHWVCGLCSSCGILNN